MLPDQVPHGSEKAILIVELVFWCHMPQRWTTRPSLSWIPDSQNLEQNKMVILSHCVLIGIVGCFLKGSQHLFQSMGSGFVNWLRSGNCDGVQFSILEGNDSLLLKSSWVFQLFESSITLISFPSPCIPDTLIPVALESHPFPIKLSK